MAAEPQNITCWRQSHGMPAARPWVIASAAEPWWGQQQSHGAFSGRAMTYLQQSHAMSARELQHIGGKVSACQRQSNEASVAEPRYVCSRHQHHHRLTKWLNSETSMPACGSAVPLRLHVLIRVKVPPNDDCYRTAYHTETGSNKGVRQIILNQGLDCCLHSNRQILGFQLRTASAASSQFAST